MKAEHRKQLETNILADRLGKFVEGFKQGPSRTTWIVAGAALVILLLFFIWRYFAASSEEKNSARWIKADEILQGQVPTPEGGMTPVTEPQMEEFRRANEGTMQARVVLKREADNALAEGQKQFGGSGGLERIRKAAGIYDKIQGDFTDIPALHQEIILSAGKAHEMIGEFAKALSYYDQLKKDYPNSAFLAQAEAGQKRLHEGTQARSEVEDLSKASRKSP